MFCAEEPPMSSLSFVHRDGRVVFYVVFYGFDTKHVCC
jgi:hypothetical protein